MGTEQLRINAKPGAKNAAMVMGLSGWMDGGDVSTGTIQHLAAELGAEAFAEIVPDDFYIYSFPGSMEIAAMFRPHAKIEDGRVVEYTPPRNTFYCDRANNIVLFEGKEPNLNWADYAECVFAAASLANVTTVYFVGSVGGLVPHTRAPRFFGSVSNPRLKATLEAHGIKFSNYEGPASVVTLLLTLAEQKDLDMTTLVAEIPPYIQGQSYKCIEAVIRKLAAILRIPVSLDELRTLSDAQEKRLTEIVEERDELAAHIRKLEEDYDNDVFDTQMGDLKQWLEQQGIRLD